MSAGELVEVEVAGHIDVAHDSDGNAYTTHCFAEPGDPWFGARIILPGVMRELHQRGLLPLFEERADGIVFYSLASGDA